MLCLSDGVLFRNDQIFASGGEVDNVSAERALARGGGGNVTHNLDTTKASVATKVASFQNFP